METELGNVDGERKKTSFSLGIIGFGAFGRLATHHLSPHAQISAFDPTLRGGPVEDIPGVIATDLKTAAACSFVLLAMPVEQLGPTLKAIVPFLRDAALVLDVCSVKSIPARLMQEALPKTVDIIATHPLFGPQSARNGIAGLKIAICPVRGRRLGLVARFLRRALQLQVILATPEEHDREAAIVQGLTRLIAKVLSQMEPLPTQMTTRSFDLLVEAIEMVRYDPPEIFHAIERMNPYAGEVRDRFFTLATQLNLPLLETDSARPYHRFVKRVD